MSKTLSGKDNVIDLATFRFPVGCKAWHPVYRICDVVESSGNQRKIKKLKLGSFEMIWEYVFVHVNELEQLAIPSI